MSAWNFNLLKRQIDKMKDNQVRVLYQSSSSVFQYKSEYIPFRRNTSNNSKI